MARVSIRHNPDLTAERAQEVFENHFRGKYKVYPTARLVVGNFIVEKNAVLAIFVTLEQKEGQTSFKFFHQYPTVWMRLLLAILFPISLAIALTAGKQLENEIRSFIENEPEFS